MHFLEWKCLNSDKNFTEVCSQGSNWNIPAMVQIMAWRRPGDRPLSEPMMVSLPTHICVARPQWVDYTGFTSADKRWNYHSGWIITWVLQKIRCCCNVTAKRLKCPWYTKWFRFILIQHSIITCLRRAYLKDKNEQLIMPYWFTLFHMDTPLQLMENRR